MSKQDEKKGINWALVVGFVAIVLGVFAAAMAAQTMKLLNEAETPELVFCHQSQPCVDFLNTYYVSENEWFHHNQILNSTFDGILTDLSSAKIAVSTLQNKFIIVEHTSEIPTTTPDSLAKCAADFDLKTLKITGEFEDRFTAAQAVFIRGDYKEGVQGDYKITRGSQTVFEQQVSTASDGSFLGRFNEALDQPTGQYTAEFQLGGLSDCISFYIE